MMTLSREEKIVYHRLKKVVKKLPEYATEEYQIVQEFNGGKHARVSLLENSSGDKIVKKTYPKRHLMIFFNEVKQLYKLRNADFVPQLLKIRPMKRTLFMSYCGSGVSKQRFKSPEVQKTIKRYQRELLNRWKIYHNDLKTGNVCSLGEKLYLIDFGWTHSEKLRAGHGHGRFGENPRNFLEFLER